MRKYCVTDNGLHIAGTQHAFSTEALQRTQQCGNRREFSVARHLFSRRWIDVDAATPALIAAIERHVPPDMRPAGWRVSIVKLSHALRPIFAEAAE